MSVGETRRVLLSGQWHLLRAPLRSEGDRSVPDQAAADDFGEVAVPGNIQVQLGFENLWLDVPELTTINHHEWLYVRELASPELGGEERAFLEFEAADYFCDVYLNGRHCGHHEGMFTRFELDVTDALASEGGANELVVAVSCPWRVDGRQVLLQPSTVFSPNQKNSEYMKGNLLHYWDGLPFSGNAVFPFGLWKDVHLAVRPRCSLRSATVSTLAIDGSAARLEATLEWSSSSESTQVRDVVLEIAPETFEGVTTTVQARVEVADGDSESRVAFDVEDARLWWTWDLGTPELYRLRVLDDGGRPLGGSVFGIRRLERDPDTLAYALNGQRLFVRGVWYPFANIFPSLPSAEEHERDVSMLRDANVNHIIGFTYVEKSSLYDACDRQGILVFQELPFQQLGPMKVLDPAHPRFSQYWSFALAAVDDIVRQLRGHPSVVLWGAFAETRKQGKWLYGDYGPFSDEIAEIVRRLDSDALYHPSFCDFDEEHIWDGGFPDGEFWDHYDRNFRFISEYGAIAPPVVETLEEILPPGAAWGQEQRRSGRVGLPIDVEEYSFRWSFDYPGLCNSVARLFRWVDRDPPSLERFVDGVQWYQALGLRYCAEVYRRKRFRDIAGCRTWSYRENVPGIKFTVVDHHQRPKMGYFALRTAYAPLLLSLDEQYPLRARAAGSEYRRSLSIVNDGPAPRRLRIETGLHGIDGAALATSSHELSVPGDDDRAVEFAVTLPSQAGNCLLRSLGYDDDGAEIARSEWWLKVVTPAFSPAVRVLLLGQARYNQPIVEAFADVPGVEFDVVDERVRQPRDSAWSENLPGRVDVIWFSGWDYAAHQFRPSEWENLAAAVAAGVGFVHTGSQGSFHGGDGRGAYLEITALGDALPVVLRPHDGIWDYVPVVEDCGAADRLGVSLEGLSPPLFHRTTARPGSDVLATIDGSYPLLVTGRHGGGATVAFMGGLVQPLRKFGVEFRDPLEVEPPWSRKDIRAYSPFWPGTLQLGLGLLVAATGRELSAPIPEIVEAARRPLFEALAELPATQLAARIESLAERAGVTTGVVEVENSGGIAARLVRGRVLSDRTNDHRFLDGFVDLLPGERARLRFECAGSLAAVSGVQLRAQNGETVARPSAGRVR